MSLLSKLLMSDWSFPYNCYEVGHTWTPSCSEAALELGGIVFIESCKAYAPLYFVQLIRRRRFGKGVIFETVKNILQSSSFFGFAAFVMMITFCGTRKVSGKFYWLVVSYMPVFVGSVLGILLESPDRRGAVAIQCANVASETVYRMLVSRGMFVPVANGEVAVFTISIAILLFFISKRGYCDEVTSLILKLIIGNEEFSKKHDQIKLLSIDKIKLREDGKVDVDSSLLLKNEPTFNKYFCRHRSCPHDHSCLLYAINSSLRAFLLGWTFEALFSMSTKFSFLFQRFSIKSQLTQLIKSELFSSNNIKFGLFLGIFTLSFKSTKCILRHLNNGSRDWHSFAAGLLAGPSMFICPNPTIAIYLLWKAIESLYFEGVERGMFGYVQQTIILTFALSAAQMAYVAVMEPNNLRPSYMKFFDRFTGHRLHQFNRLVLDVFGTGASKGYEDYFPDLYIPFTSRQFQENILTWLL